jgi:hypothetical protein
MIKKILLLYLAIFGILFGNIATAEPGNEKYLGNLAYRPVVWNTKTQLERKPRQLHNGSYSSGDDMYAETLTMTGQVVGDINGDGIPDALVILSHNYGGSGTVIQMAAVIGYPGKRLAHVASINLGDRVQVLDVAIRQSGRIDVQLSTRDSIFLRYSYMFRNNRLIKV